MDLVYACSFAEPSANFCSTFLFATIIQGAKAGIAVGVVVAALLLIGGGAFFFVKKRKAKTAASAAHLPNYNEAHGVPAGATPAQVAAMGEKPRL